MTHKNLKDLKIFIPHKIINQAKFHMPSLTTSYPQIGIHRINKKKNGESQSYLETDESELNKHRYLGHNFNHKRI